MNNKWYFNSYFICALFIFWPLVFPPLIGIILTIKKNEYEKLLNQKIKQLTTDNTNLQNLLTPEMQDTFLLQQMTSQLEDKKNELKQSVNVLNKEIQEKRNKLIVLDEEVLIQQFGLYKPQFDFASALDYKEALAKIRTQQKELIKSGKAVYGNKNWQVDGSSSKGKKMVSDTQKLLLRAFNIECDDIVSKVKYTNFDASLNRIYKAAETISKLGTTMNIYITSTYIDAKTKELRLAFEYQQKNKRKKRLQRLHEKNNVNRQKSSAKLKNNVKKSKKNKPITTQLMIKYYNSYLFLLMIHPFFRRNLNLKIS